MVYSTKFVVQQMRPEIIEARPGRRPINQETVDLLATSMAKIGLRQPITIESMAMGEGAGFWIITGAHRLAAARKLGWKTIPCYIESLSELDARLWEISENLHRAELSVGERADQIAEWIRLTAVSVNLTETRRQGRPGAIAEASRQLGVDENEARRAVRIANIEPEAREAAREAGLDDNQSALLRIARADDQVGAVTEIVKAKAMKPKRQPATITLAADEYVAEAVARLAEWDRARAERLEAWPAVAALFEDFGDDINRLRPAESLEFATHVVADHAGGLPELFMVIKPTLDDFAIETVREFSKMVIDYINDRTDAIEEAAEYIEIGEPPTVEQPAVEPASEIEKKMALAQTEPIGPELAAGARLSQLGAPNADPVAAFLAKGGTVTKCPPSRRKAA